MKTHKLMRMFLAPISPFSILIAGFYSFMWGLWVALPFWDTFAKSPIYEVLSWTGSEVIWGGIQMVIGVILMAAAFDSLRGMKYATFAGFVTWTWITISFAIADFHNAGMWVTGFLAATHGYMFLNTAKRDK